MTPLFFGAMTSGGVIWRHGLLATRGTEPEENELVDEPDEDRCVWPTQIVSGIPAVCAGCCCCTGGWLEAPMLDLRQRRKETVRGLRIW